MLNIEKLKSMDYQTGTSFFLAFNERSSNIKLNTAFTRSIELRIEQTGTSIFRPLNGLKRVHILVIELEYPIFGFKS